MYLSAAAVSWAIRKLKEGTHPFLGITFLTCKRRRLPVGSKQVVSIDEQNRQHLDEHHRLDSRSEFYFQPFRSTKWWVAKKYHAAGLQAINTQTFATAFLHERGEKYWGFQSDYVGEIARILDESSYTPAPIEAIAIWLGKDDRWHADDSMTSIVQYFLNRYHITERERDLLFSQRDLPKVHIQNLFEEQPPDLRAVAYDFGFPKDLPEETEGTLSGLHLRDIGPAKAFDLEFGERLTLIAGDNGLGKSFLLDVAWWAITGKWVEKAAFPTGSLRAHPSIKFEIRSTTNKLLIGESYFDWASRSWIVRNGRPSVAALCMYVRVDGSFAIFDEARARLQGDNQYSGFFASHEVWDGKPGEIEGLIRDWVSWQLSKDQSLFQMLSRVLESLSPEDLGELKPGEPTRIPGDPRSIPTIQHPYGEVPIVFCSAGVQRILLVAYLAIWSWQEHALAAKQMQEEPCRKMVIVVDELEAHLHPRWQRTMLPALMQVGSLLSETVDVQVIVSTHSPMVLASMESAFMEQSDSLCHLSLEDSEVILEPLEFEKYGDIAAWLTSPVFGLQHARSRDAEKVIERAKAVQMSPEPNVDLIRVVSDDLRQVLGPDDPFWPRWSFFAERFGVHI